MTLGAPMENGWPECDLSDCDYATIPGTALRLPFRRGIPCTILQAFLRDLDQFIESANNSRGYSDEGSWTDNNSVYTSNHKGASAFDYNWDDHPMGAALAGWHGSDIVPGEQEPAVRELLSFYTYKGIQLVWWGNDWNSPKDSMHFQMGYNTANNPDICNEFIARFVRADGFSTFRRGNATVVPSPVSAKDQHTLDIIAEGRRRGISERGLKIALATALVESNITIYANQRVPESMSIYHEAVGSDAYSVGIFQQQVRDTGNGWWWSDAATCMDPTKSAGLFYDRLARLDYNGSNSPGSYAQAVQSSAYPDRYDERFEEASRLYDRLKDTSGDDFLSELSPAEQRRLLERTDQVWGALYNDVQSESPYAKAGGDPVKTKDLVRYIDGSTHALAVEAGARVGDPTNIAQVASAAGRGVKRAQLVLADLEQNNPGVLQNYLAQKGSL